MSRRPRDGTQPLVPRGIPKPQLRHEVLPFVLDLPPRRMQPAGELRTADLAGIELVSACDRLPMHTAQIFRDRGERPIAAPEALELRVMCVAARAAGEHRLREQRLA